MPGEPPAWISLDARYISEGADGIVYLCICADVTYIRKEQELWLVRKDGKYSASGRINSLDWDIEKYYI